MGSTRLLPAMPNRLEHPPSGKFQNGHQGPQNGRQNGTPFMRKVRQRKKRGATGKKEKKTEIVATNVDTI